MHIDLVAARDFKLVQQSVRGGAFGEWEWVWKHKSSVGVSHICVFFYLESWTGAEQSHRHRTSDHLDKKLVTMRQVLIIKQKR